MSARSGFYTKSGGSKDPPLLFYLSGGFDLDGEEGVVED